MAIRHNPCLIAGVPKQTVSLEPRRVTLRDGSSAVTRPIGPADADSLSCGLRRLSPEGNAYRFLHHRKRFTEEELHYLTHCDFVDHIALIFAVVESGVETDRVGVARCIRSKDDTELAEVAIVFVDEWQRRGAGTALLRHLADLAWESGIRRWMALMYDGNLAAERLFLQFGDELSRGRGGFGTNEVVYALRGPNPSSEVVKKDEEEEEK